MSSGLSTSNRHAEVGPAWTAGIGRFSVPGAWSLVLLAWAGVALGTGTTWGALFSWLIAVAVGVLLPGVAVVRAVRPATVPLLEDIAWGAAGGCLVTLCGWAVDLALPVPVPPWVFGPAVAVSTLLFARTRHRVLARPAPGWGVGPNLVLAGAMLVAIAWMTTDFLALTRPDPGPAGHTYYPDVIYQLALVSEARQSLVMDYPLVAGERLPYHYFVSAVLAHLSTDSGVDTFDAVLRLAPTSLVLAVILLAAVVARRIAGRVTAGPIAALLLAVVGTTVAAFWTTDGQSVAVIQTYWWASLTAALGWLAILAVAGCAVAVIDHDDGVPVRLLVPFAVLAAGAKSAVLPVLLGGAGLAMLVALVTRRWRLLARTGIVFGVIAVTLVGSLLTIYRGSSSGLQFHPGALMTDRAAGMFAGLVDPARGPSALLVGTVVVLFLVPLLPRLVGLVLLRGELGNPVVWFLVGTLVAGCGAAMAFRHPGVSQLYFLIAAYPVAVVGSAWGIALLVDSQPRGSPWRAAGAVGVGFGALSTVVVAWRSGRVPPMLDWTAATGHPPTAAEVGVSRQVLWWAEPLLLLTAVLVAVGLGAYLLIRAWPRMRRTRRAFPVLVVGVVLGSGLLSTALYLTGASTTPTTSRGARGAGSLPVTSDQLTAGRWLDDNAGPADVLAVNRMCLEPQTSAELPQPCTAKFFTMAATAQRAVEVGGWAYAPRNVEGAWSTDLWYPHQPFWDQARLRQELRAFTDPTPALLAELYQRRGVRWLVADHGGAPPDAGALDRLADRRVSLPTVTVWQLRPPL